MHYLDIFFKVELAKFVPYNSTFEEAFRRPKNSLKTGKWEKAKHKPKKNFETGVGSSSVSIITNSYNSTARNY